MPTHCTEPARCSGIRNRWPVRTRAGKPDSPGRRFEPPPASLLRPSRSPKLPKPDFASVSPSRQAGTIRLQFGVDTVIGIDVAIGVAAGGRRLALLVARKTAIAAARAEIAALDAEWIIPRRRGQGVQGRERTAHQQSPECCSHGFLRCRIGRRVATEQTSLAVASQFTFARDSGAARRSVEGKARRPNAAAIAIGARIVAVADANVKGVLDAIEKPT